MGSSHPLRVQTGGASSSSPMGLVLLPQQKRGASPMNAAARASKLRGQYTHARGTRGRQSAGAIPCATAV